MRTKLRSKVTLLFMTLGMLLAVPAVAFAADTIIADSDTVSMGDQASRDLGVVGPGATVQVGVAPAKPQVDFYLDCGGQNHFNSGEQATIAFNSAGSSIKDASNVTPATGSLSATSLTNITGPSSWPGDNAPGVDSSCGTIANAKLGSSEVTIVAPNSAGTYTYKVAYVTTRGTGTESNELSTDINNLPGQGTAANPDLVTFTLKVDATKPTITLTKPAEGDSYNVGDSVTVAYTCQDETGGSGIKSCVGDKANGETLDTSTPGNYTFTVNAEDKAGNKESVTHNYTVVNPDQVALTSTASATVPNGTGTSPYTGGTSWTNKDVTVSLSASDNTGGSGVKKLVYSATGADPIDETTDTTAPFEATLTIDAEGTTTIKYFAEDNNGNVETAKTFVVNIDKVKPVISATATVPNGDDAGTDPDTYTAGTWTNKDVKVSFSCTDALSGTDTNTVAGATKDTTGADQSVTNSGTSTDKAGNTADSKTFDNIDIDKVLPTITGSRSPGANADGWTNQSVAVSFQCDDQPALSGIASCVGNDTVTTEGANQSRTGTATDKAGNTASDTVNGISIDKSKPVVTVTGVSDGTTYTTGNVPTPGCETKDQDSLSGVKTNATVNVTGGTGGFGTLTATCSGASDKAGNTNSASVTYGVSAAFNGFLQPIDGHAVNTGKYGRTYPIKWQLRDSSGALISDTTAQLLVGTMTGGQKSVNCGSFTLLETDALEEATTGNTSLRCDATSDQFIYNYKAPTSGSCYIFAIRNADGLTTQQIDFQFTK